jgi:hypothetical protein
MVGGAWSVVALLSIGAPRFVAGAFLVTLLVFVAPSALAAVLTEVAGVAAAAACFVAAVFAAAVFVAAVFVAGVVLAAVPFAWAGAVVADFVGAALTVAFVGFATVPAGAAFAVAFVAFATVPAGAALPVAFVAFAVAFVACAAFEGADALLVVPVVPVFLAGDAAAFDAAFRAAVARSAMASPKCKTGARRGAAHSRGWQGYGL